MEEYLVRLSCVTTRILNTTETAYAIDNLKNKITNSPEPFLWHPVNLTYHLSDLPKSILSCWIFAIKKPTGAHIHPNSKQHTTIIEGKGQIRIGKYYKTFKCFKPTALNTWYIIEKGIPHEFFPEKNIVLVISYHTCKSNELIEIRCDNGAKRIYK